MVTPPPIELGSLGMADSLILMVLALVVFGPRRLPQIGRQIGKLMYEFRKASNDFKFQMEEELRVSEEADRRKKEEAERQAKLALAPPVTPTVEAQADIGALEAPAPAAESSSPVATSPYSGESAYPEQYPADAEPRTEIPLPRIQPPATGAPIAAARPGAAVEPSIEARPTATEAVPPPAEPAASTPEISKEPTRTEPVSQNG